MKKYLLLLITILLFIPIIVNGETCDNNKVYIDSISLEKTNNVNEIATASALGKTININLNMTEVGDNIKYRINLKNDTDEDYLLDNNSININSNYMNYSISSNDNSNIVKAKSSKIVYLNVQYKNQVPNSLSSNDVINDNITMKVNLSTNDSILNPNTGVNILL